MRSTILFNNDWIFHMPDREPERVTLPHTWNGSDGQDGGGDYLRCRCVYEKKFPKPEMEPDGRCQILFRGVNSTAIVKINGKQTVMHEGGYSSFVADITDELQEDNLLEVIADNRENETVYPQFADFTFYGGIYRDVEMILTGPSYFAFGPNCSPPLKVTTEVEGSKGKLKVRDFHEGVGNVVVTVMDHQGHPIIQKASDVMGHADLQIEIDQIHLWNGILDPYLYTVRAELYEDEKLLDIVETNVGFRNFYVDPKKGFFLNGKPYPLQGVCRHQDRPDIGNAITKKMQEEDIELLRDLGATSVRLTHYQHDQYFYELCDKYGIIVSTEIPLISKYLPQGDENAFQQMRELVRQNYNHASIVFWCLSNEITIKKVTAQTVRLHEKLNQFCHTEDPGRLTTLTCYMVMNKRNPLAHITDVVSYNLYYGWYIPFYYWAGWTLDSFHRKYPDQPIGLAEYGAEAMPQYHSRYPKAMDNTEEFQCIFHEQYQKILDQRPFVWGNYAWLLADCGSDGRNQGGDPGKNHKGLVTFDRKIKKDAYYMYKAFWKRPEEEKFVHICGKRYQKRCGKYTEVKVYSNTGRVTLYNNGELVGTKDGEKIFTFRVRMKKTNKLIAKGDGCQDESIIMQVSRPDPEYKMRVKSNGLSWEKTKEKKK